MRHEIQQIGREAIGNAFRHSQGSSIDVEIAYTATEFRVLVRDDGVGIEPDLLKDGRTDHWDSGTCANER